VYTTDCTIKGVAGNRYCTKTVFFVIQQYRTVRAWRATERTVRERPDDVTKTLHKQPCDCVDIFRALCQSVHRRLTERIHDNLLTYIFSDLCLQ